MADYQYDDGLVLRSIVDDLVPEHVSNAYPGLMHAIKVYADFLEHSNGAGHWLNTIDAQRDIDRIETELLTELQKEIGAPIPRQFAADPRKFYKRVTEYYRGRGTPASIETFFRVLFNDDVEIYFPKEDMLIPSDGKWFDRTDDVIANPQLYTPLFTYTLHGNGDTVSGGDDSGRELIYDNPIVFVNNIYTTEYSPMVEVNTTTNKLEYSIKFDNELQTGDKVEVYGSGSFSNNDGFLDNYKKIQDSFFYQKFSYVLRTGTNADDWKNPFARLVHPAGFIFFGEILLFLDNLGQTFPQIQPGFQTGGLPFPIIIPVVDASSAYVKTLGNVIASFIVKSYKPQTNINIISGGDNWETLKFKYTDPVSQIGNFTVEDVINNKIKYNIDSVIEISS
jgi:hypothetical protein